MQAYARRALRQHLERLTKGVIGKGGKSRRGTQSKAFQFDRLKVLHRRLILPICKNLLDHILCSRCRENLAKAVHLVAEVVAKLQMRYKLIAMRHERCPWPVPFANGSGGIIDDFCAEKDISYETGGG